MIQVFVQLDSFEKIKDFINITNKLDYDLDLVADKYIVDGKSIMGILSLDLSKPIMVQIINSNEYPDELIDFIIKPE